MKKYYIYIANSLIIIFSFSCNNIQNKKIEHASGSTLINNFDSLASINIDEIFDTLSYKVLRLESIKESLFGQIDKVIITDNYVFVLDVEYANAVIVFDKNGKFIQKIGRQGRGPGEYARLIDIDVDYKNHQIVLYDLNARKLIFYAFEGSFIKEIYLKDYYGMAFSFIDDSAFAFYLHFSTDLKDELLIVNDAGEITNSLFKRLNKNKQSVLINSNYFAKSGSKIYLIPSYSGKLYEIVNTMDILKKMDLHLEDKMIKDKNIRKLKEPNEIFGLRKFTPLRDLNINSSGKFFCISNFNNGIVRFFGDIKTGEYIAFNGFSNNKFISDDFISTYEEYFISTEHPIKYKNSIFPDADISDNLCLVFLKLKSGNITNYKAKL